MTTNATTDRRRSQSFFPGFLVEDIRATGATIRTLRAGSGPPLLLLHGYPQTHVIWHKIAGRLAERFTVVLTDLRGYGDSSKPEGGTRHANYSFRAMAQDQLEVMRHLGYERFGVASHDRGARTAHRLCLDHPQAVRKVCFMDIVPTLRMYRDTSMEFATKYMWWFFLIQKAPLPEHMIGADPEFFLTQHFEVQNGTPGTLSPEAIEEYKRCFCTPEAIHASGEDYRASAEIDLEEDPRSIALIEAFSNAGKPVAAVCHAPGVLHRVQFQGQPIVKGKRVTGFTNGEEEAVHLTKVVPFLVEDELKRLGGLYEKVENWKPFVVTDGRLVTGQNPASSRSGAEVLLKLLA